MWSVTNIGALLLSIAIPVGAGFIGSAVGGGGDSDWYKGLNKPPWTPPVQNSNRPCASCVPHFPAPCSAGWVFPVMWTTLYTMMGIASWLVWRQGGFSQQGYPLGAYVFQLALNILWTPIFFGMRRPDFSLVEIVILLLAIAVTIYLFWPVNAIAAYLLVPYVLWVCVAILLNWYIWMYNGNGISDITQPLQAGSDATA